MSAKQQQFDDVDLLLRRGLQQDEAEVHYERAWAKLRERIEQQRRTQQATMARHALPNYQRDIGWQVRCHWYVIEPISSPKLQVIR